MQGPPVHLLRAVVLDAGAFAPFGDVIEARPGAAHTINAGFADKYADLARIETAAAGGRTALHLYHARARTLPLRVTMLERHRHGSQAFVPLHAAPFVIVVAPRGDSVDAHDLRAFVTDGAQGCNLAPGVWHHPLVALRDGSFVVVDRVAAPDDCDEVVLPIPVDVVR